MTAGIPGYLPSTEAAQLAGVSPGALRTRRHREGSEHPRWVCVGGTVLYNHEAFVRYVERWTDNRYTAE